MTMVMRFIMMLIMTIKIVMISINIIVQFLLLSWLERLIPLLCVYDAASTVHRIYLIIPNLILTGRF